MLLVCDIGNSHISFGLFQNKELIRSFHIATDKKAGLNYYEKELKPHLSEISDIESILLASVASEITTQINKALSNLTGVVARNLTNIDIPLVNKYNNPELVGVDRLLNAYGALQYMSAPLIIVDFGTATTFDVVSSNKEYLGGAIVPGIETSLEALFGKASKLSSVELKKPSEIIGHSTEESIRSGVVIGTAGLVDKLILEIQKDLGKCNCIATGGLAGLIIPYCEEINKIEPNLTLTAMAHLLYLNRNKR